MIQVKLFRMGEIKKDESEPVTSVSTFNTKARLKQCFKEIILEYCHQSSIGGLKNVVASNKTKKERILWMIIIMTSLVCSCLLAIITLITYTNSPLVMSQVPQGYPVEDIIFPAISICTFNRISLNSVKMLAKQIMESNNTIKMNETEILRLMLNLGHFYRVEINTLQNDELKLLHDLLGEYDPRELLKNLTPPCDKVLKKCLWKYEITDCNKLYDFRLTTNGYCCTFNYLRTTDDFFNEDSERNRNGNKTFQYQSYGLKAIIENNVDDTFYSMLAIDGAMVTISDAFDFPDHSSGGFSTTIANLNTELRLCLKPSVTEATEDIKRIPLSLRGCLFSDESPYIKIYTYSDCFLKCRAQFLLKMCNCVPFNVPKLYADTRTCNLLDLSCLKNVSTQSYIVIPPNLRKIPQGLELDITNGINCVECYPTCSKVDYFFKVEKLDIFPEQLSLLPKEQDFQVYDTTNVSIIQILYCTGRVEGYQQKIVLEWFDLFSIIGSSCGLITGFSLVSVMEIIYFFTIKLFRKYKFKNNTTACRQVPQSSASSADGEPYTIYWKELISVKRNKNW